MSVVSDKGPRFCNNEPLSCFLPLSSRGCARCYGKKYGGLRGNSRNTHAHGNARADAFKDAFSGKDAQKGRRRNRCGASVCRSVCVRCQAIMFPVRGGSPESRDREPVAARECVRNERIQFGKRCAHMCNNRGFLTGR